MPLPKLIYDLVKSLDILSLSMSQYLLGKKSSIIYSNIVRHWGSDKSERNVFKCLYMHAVQMFALQPRQQMT